MRNSFVDTRSKSSSNLFLAVAAFPLILGVIIVSVIPTVTAIGAAFTDLVLGFNVKWKFIGFENFNIAFKNKLFLNSFKIGVIWALSVTLLSILIGLITVLLSNKKGILPKILKFGAMVPWAISPVAIAIIWQILLDPSAGPINWFLRKFDLPGKNLSLLGDFNTAFPTVIVIGAWVSLPVIVISISAALKSLKQELVEAAQIDGANGAMIFRNIVLPHLRPVLTALFVLNIIWNFNSFGLVYVLTAGGPGGKTDLPALFVYHESFKYGNLGYASALGVIITISLVIVLGIYVFIRNRNEVEA